MNRNLLKSKMALNGMQDKDLCDLLELSKSAVSRRLNGEISFSAAEIKIMQTRLKLSDREVHLIFLS